MTKQMEVIMQYQIREHQTGKVFEMWSDVETIRQTMKVYKIDDNENAGGYDPDFYEIVAIDDDGKVIGRWNGDGDFIDGTDAAGRNFEVYF